MSEEDFSRALNFAREKELTTIFLHGGEPSIHSKVVKFAQMAKDAGFLVKMFTNGLERKRIEGFRIRMANKSLNPTHLKYSMTPYGKIQSNFERYFEEIVKKPKSGRVITSIGGKNETS